MTDKGIFPTLQNVGGIHGIKAAPLPVSMSDSLGSHPERSEVSSSDTTAQTRPPTAADQYGGGSWLTSLKARCRLLFASRASHGDCGGRKTEVTAHCIIFSPGRWGRK